MQIDVTCPPLTLYYYSCALPVAASLSLDRRDSAFPKHLLTSWRGLGVFARIWTGSLSGESGLRAETAKGDEDGGGVGKRDPTCFVGAAANRGDWNTAAGLADLAGRRSSGDVIGDAKDRFRGLRLGVRGVMSLTRGCASVTAFSPTSRADCSRPAASAAFPDRRIACPQGEGVDPTLRPVLRVGVGGLSLPISRISPNSGAEATLFSSSLPVNRLAELLTGDGVSGISTTERETECAARHMARSESCSGDGTGADGLYPSEAWAAKMRSRAVSAAQVS